jgi:hypothetical protein
VAWAFVGVGCAAGLGTFSWTAVALVVAGSVVLAVTLLTDKAPPISSGLVAVLLGLTALTVPFFARHRGGPDALSVLTIVATVAALAIVVTGWLPGANARDNDRRCWAVMALAGGAGVATLLASPVPGNDVWFSTRRRHRRSSTATTSIWRTGRAGSPVRT